MDFESYNRPEKEEFFFINVYDPLKKINTNNFDERYDD